MSQKFLVDDYDSDGKYGSYTVGAKWARDTEVPEPDVFHRFPKKGNGRKSSVVKPPLTAEVFPKLTPCKALSGGRMAYQDPESTEWLIAKPEDVFYIKESASHTESPTVALTAEKPAGVTSESETIPMTTEASPNIVYEFGGESTSKLVEKPVFKTPFPKSKQQKAAARVKSAQVLCTSPDRPEALSHNLSPTSWSSCRFQKPSACVDLKPDSNLNLPLFYIPKPMAPNAPAVANESQISGTIDSLEVPASLTTAGLHGTPIKKDVPNSLCIPDFDFIPIAEEESDILSEDWRNLALNWGKASIEELIPWAFKHHHKSMDITPSDLSNQPQTAVLHEAPPPVTGETGSQVPVVQGNEPSDVMDIDAFVEQTLESSTCSQPALDSTAELQCTDQSESLIDELATGSPLYSPNMEELPITTEDCIVLDENWLVDFDMIVSQASDKVLVPQPLESETPTRQTTISDATSKTEAIGTYVVLASGTIEATPQSQLVPENEPSEVAMDLDAMLESDQTEQSTVDCKPLVTDQASSLEFQAPDLEGIESDSHMEDDSLFEQITFTREELSLLNTDLPMELDNNFVQSTADTELVLSTMTPKLPTPTADLTQPDELMEIIGESGTEKHSNTPSTNKDSTSESTDLLEHVDDNVMDWESGDVLLNLKSVTEESSLRQRKKRPRKVRVIKLVPKGRRAIKKNGTAKGARHRTPRAKRINRKRPVDQRTLEELSDFISIPLEPKSNCKKVARSKKKKVASKGKKVEEKKTAAKPQNEELNVTEKTINVNSVCTPLKKQEENTSHIDRKLEFSPTTRKFNGSQGNFTYIVPKALKKDRKRKEQLMKRYVPIAPKISNDEDINAANLKAINVQKVKPKVILPKVGSTKTGSKASHVTSQLTNICDNEENHVDVDGALASDNNESSKEPVMVQTQGVEKIMPKKSSPSVNGPWEVVGLQQRATGSKASNSSAPETIQSPVKATRKRKGKSLKASQPLLRSKTQWKKTTKCEFCPKSFRNNFTMRRHMNKKHESEMRQRAALKAAKAPPPPKKRRQTAPDNLLLVNQSEISMAQDSQSDSTVLIMKYMLAAKAKLTSNSQGIPGSGPSCSNVTVAPKAWIDDAKKKNAEIKAYHRLKQQETSNTCEAGTEILMLKGPVIALPNESTLPTHTKVAETQVLTTSTPSSETDQAGGLGKMNIESVMPPAALPLQSLLPSLTNMAVTQVIEAPLIILPLELDLPNLTTAAGTQVLMAPTSSSETNQAGNLEKVEVALRTWQLDHDYEKNLPSSSSSDFSLSEFLTFNEGEKKVIPQEMRLTNDDDQDEDLKEISIPVVNFSLMTPVED